MFAYLKVAKVFFLCFIVLSFTMKTTVYFKLIFVYVVRYGSGLFFCIQRNLSVPGPLVEKTALVH